MTTRPSKTASWLLLVAGVMGTGAYMVAQDLFSSPPPDENELPIATPVDPQIAANDEIELFAILEVEGAEGEANGGASNRAEQVFTFFGGGAPGEAPATGDESAPPSRLKRAADSFFAAPGDAAYGTAPAIAQPGNSRGIRRGPEAGRPGRAWSAATPAYAGHPYAVSGIVEFPAAPAGLSNEAHELIGLFHHGGDEQRADAFKKLQALMAKEFDERHSQHEQQYKQLVERLQRVRESLDRRAKLKDEIVRNRVEMLTGGSPELQWDFQIPADGVSGNTLDRGVRVWRESHNPVDFRGSLPAPPKPPTSITPSAPGIPLDPSTGGASETSLPSSPPTGLKPPAAAPALPAPPTPPPFPSTAPPAGAQPVNPPMRATPVPNPFGSDNVRP